MRRRVYSVPGNAGSYVSCITDDVDCSSSTLSSSCVRPRIASMLKSVYSRRTPSSSTCSTGQLSRHRDAVPPAEPRGPPAENSVDTAGHRRTVPPAKPRGPQAENSVDTAGHRRTVPPAEPRRPPAANSVDTAGHRRTVPPAEPRRPPAENSVDTAGRRTISGTGSGSGARRKNGDVITRTNPAVFMCWYTGGDTSKAACGLLLLLTFWSLEPPLTSRSPVSSTRSIFRDDVTAACVSRDAQMTMM